MADRPLRYVICYDVADDRRRGRIAQILQGFGQRVQYSVFEALLDRRLFENLVSQIAGLADAADDRVAFYPLCSSCSGKRHALGVHVNVVPDAECVFVV